MFLTLSTRDVLPATPRARIVHLDLAARAFPFAPGQAVLIASHGVEKRRPYSLASAPADVSRDGALELLVSVDESGQPGPHLHLESGAAIDVEGPVGAFTYPPDPPERRLIFIAGGVGIAPLRAMMHQALSEKGREIGVFYSARTPGEFAYADELRGLAASGRIELRMTVTRDGGPEWAGARGRIAAAHLAPLVHDAATLCFICGPQSMVDEMPAVVESLGVPRRRIRIEEW